MTVRWGDTLHILGQLVGRSIEDKYRGSALGILWALATPFLMLTVFAFVFGVVFQARWGGGAQSTFEFAIILFTGLIVFNLFAETVSAAPGLVVSQANYVKKTRFPLPLLSLAALGVSLFHAAIAMAVLMLIKILAGTGVPLSSLLLPLAILPLCLLALGLSWLVSALGVYLRDIAQIIPPLMTALMFLTPIFYPPSALPEWIRPWLAYNPLALAIDQVRSVILFGQVPGTGAWLAALAGGALAAGLGYGFFKIASRGFADVL